MASYYFRNTGDTNWGTASNWSLTDGGGATGAVPTATDDAFFSNNSGNCVVNTSSRNCKNLDFTKGTGFTGTFTNTAGLNINNSGNVTLKSGMTFTGAGSLSVITTSTITTNGVTIACPLTLGTASATITLADNLNCSGTLSFTASGTCNYNGSFTIYHSGSTTSCAGVALSSTVTLELTGNTSIATAGRISLLEIKINCGSNTFTVSGNLGLGDTTNTTKLTYVSGNFTIASTCYLIIYGSITLDTYPIEWSTIDFGGSDTANKTITLNSPLLAKIMRMVGVGTVTLVTTFAGTSGFIVGTLLCLINNSARTVTLQSGVTYRVKNQALFSGSQPQTVPTFNTSSSGSKAMWLFDKGCWVSVYGVSFTDYDNISPFIVPVFSGMQNTSVLSNSSGWKLIPVNQQHTPITNVTQGLYNGVVSGLN